MLQSIIIVTYYQPKDRRAFSALAATLCMDQVQSPSASVAYHEIVVHRMHRRRIAMTHLHLRCHSAARILASVHLSFSPLRLPRIVLRHEGRSIGLHWRQSQRLVAVSDRADLCGNGSRTRWLVKRAALEATLVSTPIIMRSVCG